MKYLPCERVTTRSKIGCASRAKAFCAWWARIWMLGQSISNETKLKRQKANSRINEVDRTDHVHIVIWCNRTPMALRRSTYIAQIQPFIIHCVNIHKSARHQFLVSSTQSSLFFDTVFDPTSSNQADRPAKVANCPTESLQKLAPLRPLTGWRPPTTYRAWRPLNQDGLGLNPMIKNDERPRSRTTHHGQMNIDPRRQGRGLMTANPEPSILNS